MADGTSAFRYNRLRVFRLLPPVNGWVSLEAIPNRKGEKTDDAEGIFRKKERQGRDRYVRFERERLYLTKIREEKDSELIEHLRRREACPVDEGYKKGLRYLVHFKITKVLPLVGSKTT